MKNPVTDDLHLAAHRLSAKIIMHLVDTWGSDPEGLRPSKEIDMSVPYLGLSSTA